MGEPDSTASSPISLTCAAHRQNAKWHCGGCGQPVCPECKPVGYDYQVFHPQCLAKHQAEKARKPNQLVDTDAPSLGMKILAWSVVVIGLIAIGTCLFLIGLAWWGNAVPIRAMITGTVAPQLNSIPGSRTAIYGLAILLGGFSIAAVITGLGLLNCVPWARIIMLLFAWLEIGIAGLAWLGIALEGKGFWDIPLIGISLIWYLSRPKVKKQFQKVL